MLVQGVSRDHFSFVKCLIVIATSIFDNSGGRGRNKIIMLVHQVPDATGDSAGHAQIQLKCCKI